MGQLRARAEPFRRAPPSSGLVPSMVSRAARGSREFRESNFSETKETVVNIIRKLCGLSSASPGPGLIDCGRASRVTQGVPILVLLEFGPPPFDKLIL